MADQFRQTAYRILISDLIKGKFIRQEGWNPSFVYLADIKAKVSRVNLMGVVIALSKEAEINEVIIDDGSGSITIRSFNNEMELKKLKFGELVNIIGKVRDFDGNFYVMPEIVKKYDNKGIKELWELERLAQDIPKEEIPVVKPENAEKILDESNPKQIVYEIIKELDTGNGVDIHMIIARAKVKNPEKVIEGLIEEGEIYKISASKVKVL
jgi:RPA family protein